MRKERSYMLPKPKPPLYPVLSAKLPGGSVADFISNEINPAKVRKRRFLFRLYRPGPFQTRTACEVLHDRENDMTMAKPVYALIGPDSFLQMEKLRQVLSGMGKDV